VEKRTFDEYLSLKSEGNNTIYFVEIGGLDVLFKPLTLGEYTDMVNLEKYVDGSLANEALLRIAVLFIGESRSVDTWLADDTLLAGYPDILADKIVNVSGFADENSFIDLIKEKREETNKFQNIIETFICTAYHKYIPDDIQNMTMIEQIELFAKAEKVLGQELDLNELLEIEDKEIDYPVPPGMESTEDILSPEHADPVQWEKIEGSITK